MTSVKNINAYDKERQNTNLYSFLKGDIGIDYTVPEEKGFEIQGNIGAIFNTNPNKLKNVWNGLIVNTLNKTNNSLNLVNNIEPSKADYSSQNSHVVPTPLLFNQWDFLNKQSELLPTYPNSNNIPNKFITPDYNLEINGTASPTLYGESLAFINNHELITNPHNNIGNELEPYGLAVPNGGRALSQGKNSCVKDGFVQPGLNVPNLGIQHNNNNSFVANPSPQFPGQTREDLYTVGNWAQCTDNSCSVFANPYSTDSNFIQEFNTYVGDRCQGPRPHRGPGPRTGPY